MVCKLIKIRKNFSLDYYVNEVLKLLVKKGFFKSENEVVRKGIFYFSRKYLNEDPDLERLEWYLLSCQSLAKDWFNESDNVWDTLLDKEYKKHKRKKKV